MDFDTLEYGIVLVGWVVGILLGTILLFVKLPADKVHFTYRRAKNTCAITIILFGLEILFQWLIRFYFKLDDPALSVFVYLMTFCVATLIFTGGFCTPTEAGAIACVYGLVVGIFFYKELNFKKITKVLFNAAEGTGQILSLYAASTMFAYIFTVEGFGKVFQEWLMSVSSGNPIVIMLLVGAFVLLIGCFMEPVAVMPVVLPLVYPLLQKMGVDMVQFGLFFTLCTVVGGLTPPVGSYLFVTVTVVRVGVTKLIPWMMVMILVDLIVILMITFIPGFCSWLPNALLGPM